MTSPSSDGVISFQGLSAPGLPSGPQTRATLHSSKLLTTFVEQPLTTSATRSLGSTLAPTPKTHHQYSANPTPNLLLHVNNRKVPSAQMSQKFVHCAKGNIRVGYCFGIESPGAQHRHADKRKDKLINLSNLPLRKHKCNRFLHNEVSFLSCTETNDSKSIQ